MLLLLAWHCCLSNSPGRVLRCGGTLCCYTRLAQRREAPRGAPSSLQELPQSKGNTRNRQGVVVGCSRSLTISSTKCKQASD